MPRRSRIAGREASAADRSEVGVADLRDAIGLSEVGVVKEIEGFGAELRVQALGELQVFDDGEVHIGEARSDQRISAQVAKVIHPGG